MILTILKYLGLCLAAVSTIWGLTHELTVKTPDNRKRLTKAGIVSILFVAIGLVLGIVSDDIGRRQAAKEQFAKVAAEARRTNEIIIAAQPLTSLNFSLQFETADTGFRKQMEDAEKEIEENAMSSQGGVPRIPFEAMEYESSLIPMLKFLSQAGDKKNNTAAKNEEAENNATDSNGIIALVPLDDAPNAILSFGEISGNAEWNNHDTANKLSAGFSSVDNGARTGTSSPQTSKTFATAGPSKYSIDWNLDPVTLESAVDRANAAIRSGAKLPRVLKLVILRIGATLPFAYNNFALTKSDPWHINKGDDTLKTTKLSNMTLTASVNGFTELSYQYKLVNVYQKPLYNDWGEEVEIGCTVFEFKLE